MARRRRHRQQRTWRMLTLAVTATATATTVTPALAQTTISGSSLALKSAGSATMSGVGFVGTYLTVPAGGATVNFTVNATAGSIGAGTPHLQLVVADTIQPFSAAATSATNYTTGNVFLPAGTYAVRTERDYAGNASVSRSLTVNNLTINTVSGGAATFANTSTDANALAAANTYINNFRKADATVTLTGPGSIPLLPGTPVRVNLARHAFNFGTAVPGSGPVQVNNYLGAGGTTQQTGYQSRLNQNFNSVVPENVGKWSNNEATRDAPTMSGVDAILNYAQSHQMRARMHNLIWGSQQPSYVGTMISNPTSPDADVAHGGTNAVGSTTITNKLGLYGATDASGNGISEISERINSYVGTGAATDRARKYTDVDVYNESYHTGEVATGNNYWSLYGPGGVASIYNEAASKFAGYATPPKLFVNEYNVFQNSGDAYANWYANHLDKIRNAGGNVGGIGIQYYPSPSIGSADNQHTPARIASVLQNLSAQGLPLSLNEFGVGTGGAQATAAQILDDSVRLMFGTPNATGFLTWGFQDEGTGNLFKGGAALYTASNNFSTWTITEAGKRWQDMLGIQDWDGNPSNGWTTDQNLVADATGTIHIAGGFFGDYYLSGQGPNGLGAKLLPFDLRLKKGTSAYTTALAKPPDWFFWKTNASGAWDSADNWTDASQSGTAPGSPGRTAYFGSAATTYDMTTGASAGTATTTNITNDVTVTLSTPVTLGMLVVDNAPARYTLAGSPITLQGYDNAAGHAAAVYVNRGSHTINAPLLLADDTTVTVTARDSTLTVSSLQPTAAAITKAGAGTLEVSQLRAGAVAVTGGTLRLLTRAGGGVGAVDRVPNLSVATSATLDLTDHRLVISDTPPGSWDGTRYTGIAGLIQSGRNGPAVGSPVAGSPSAGSLWAGTGIVTSRAAAGTFTAIGVAAAGDVLRFGPGATTATWLGETVSPTDTLVMYTYGGDANLDGIINIDDYGRIDGHVAIAGSAGWSNGDFNYDGKINIDDYGIIDGNVGSQGAPLGAAQPLADFASPTVLVVPEPAMIGITVFSHLIAHCRRRRRMSSRWNASP